MYPEVNRGMPVLPTRLCRKGYWTHRGDQGGADQAGDHACKVGCQEFSCRELERGTEQGTQGTSGPLYRGGCFNPRDSAEPGDIVSHLLVG